MAAMVEQLRTRPKRVAKPNARRPDAEQAVKDALTDFPVTMRKLAE